MELLEKLKGLSVKTGSLACFGCGHEHNCSAKGCAILREAISALEVIAQREDANSTNAAPRDKKERLTARNDDGSVFFPQCFCEDKHLACGGNGAFDMNDCDLCKWYNARSERLAAYEDTGLTPDEVVKYVVPVVNAAKT